MSLLDKFSGVNPPDAPKRDPVLATAGQEGQAYRDADGHIYVYAKGRWELTTGKFAAELASQLDGVQTETPPPTPVVEKRPRGRPPKAQTAASVGTRTLLLNCVSNQPTTPFEPIVDAIAREISDAVDNGADVRCSKHASLDFGRWKGVIATRLLEVPPGPGTYTLYATGDIYQVAAEAFASICDVVIRGVR